MLTYNGNEMMLQNDMGNTLIQDSATGNIMGLNPGFIPTGIKEHGGIMYITSVGKDDNGNPIGEIGTIPSPIIRDIYKDIITTHFNKDIPIGGDDTLTISHKLYPADKFLMNLQMEVNENDIVGHNVSYKVSQIAPTDTLNVDPCDVILYRSVVKGTNSNGKWDLNTLHHPLISYAQDIKELTLDYTDRNESDPNNRQDGELTLTSTKGLYSLQLFSKNINGVVKAHDSLTSAQQYGDLGTRSNYWFLHTDTPVSIFPKDLFQAKLNNTLKQVPTTTKPGQLSVRLQQEKIGSFNILPRKNSPNFTPITCKLLGVNGTQDNYKTFFAGFYYDTDSAVYIDKLKNIQVIDESTSKKVPIKFCYQGEEETAGFTNAELNFTNYLCDNLDHYIEGDFALNGFDWETQLWHNRLNMPQIQSKTDINTFILSSIHSINSHLKEDSILESSTVDMDTKPHSGVFYADLGDKYNNWYRLELDYFDQYGEKQGSFTTRFNPYLNDVFGTNLSAGMIQTSEAVVMGKKQEGTHESQFICEFNNVPDFFNFRYPQTPFPPVYKTRDEMRKNLSGWGTVPAEQGKDTNLIFVSNDMNKRTEYSASDFINQNINYLYDLQDISIEFKESDFSLIDNTSVYFGFGVNDDDEKKGLSKIPSIAAMRARKFDGETTPITLWTYDAADSIALEYETTEVNDKGGSISLSYIKAGTTDEKIVSNYQLVGTTHLYSQRIIESASSKIFSETWNKIPNMEIQNNGLTLEFNSLNHTSNQNRLNVTFGPLEYEGWKAEEGDFEWGIGMEVEKDSDTQRSKAIKNYNTSHSYFRIFGKTNVGQKIKASYKYTTPTPKYKIVPQVLLKGISDTGTEIYVNRAQMLDTGESAAVFSYNLKDQNMLMSLPGPTSKSCITSYQQQAKCYHLAKDAKLLDTQVSPGIYVLNIVKFPFLQADQNISLTITLGSGEAKTFTSSEIIKKGIVGYAVDQSYIVENGSFDFFEPIIIIVPTTSQLTIQVTKEFDCQNIGLYNVDLTDTQIQDIEQALSLDSNSPLIYTYLQYMEMLKSKIGIPDVNSYAFIQTYGVFFKEGYSFSDGLFHTGMLSNSVVDPYQLKLTSIQVLEDTYNPSPYISDDPQILYLQLVQDQNGKLQYLWNSYFLYEDVVTGGGSPYFVFSNDSVENIIPRTAIPGPDNLRQLNQD